MSSKSDPKAMFVKLSTTDNEILQLNVNDLRGSRFIMGLVEDLSLGECEEGSQSQQLTIPLNFTREIIELVLDWLRTHPVTSSQQPAASQVYDAERMTVGEAAFMDTLDPRSLTELAVAAQELEVDGLIQFTIFAVLHVITDKSPREALRALGARI